AHNCSGLTRIITKTWAPRSPRRARRLYVSLQATLRVSFKVRYAFFPNHFEQEVIGLKVVIIIPAFLFILSLCARAPVVSQSQDPTQSIDPIKISTDLVVVDALVTNQQTGRVIGALRADDFQLYEDKVKQMITH